MTVEPISVELTDAAFGGEAIGHLPDGRVVFVPRALPGETALARVQQERRDFARAELAGLAQAAPGRVDPPCPYYTAACGGGRRAHALAPPALHLAGVQLVVDRGPAQPLL